MTIQELKELLQLNEQLLEAAIKDDNSQRVIELANHRAIVKDMLIAALELELLEQHIAA